MSTLNVTNISDGTDTTATANVVNGSAKAWVNFNGTTNTGGNCDIRESYNVSTVGDNGTGDYTVNFTTAMPDSNYSVVGIGQEVAGPNIASVFIHRTSPYQVGSIRLRIINIDNGGVADTAFVNATVFR